MKNGYMQQFWGTSEIKCLLKKQVPEVSQYTTIFYKGQKQAQLNKFWLSLYIKNYEGKKW